MEKQENCCQHNSLVKIITAILFVALPYLGVVLGIQYQTAVSPSKEQTSVNLIKPKNSTVVSDQTPVVTQTADMSSWKTYKSELYGYSFRYPSNFMISAVTTDKIENGMNQMITSDFIYTPGTIANIDLYELLNIDNKKFFDFVKYRESSIHDNRKVLLNKNITVLSHSAVYIVSSLNGKNIYNIYLEKDSSHIITLKISNQPYQLNIKLNNEVDNILSTFRFE